MYCQCGCNQITPVAKRNRYHLGHIKGEHISYLKGHKNKGRSRPPFSDDWKKNISYVRKSLGIAKGKNNPNWRGGITKLSQQVRNSKKYAAWRWEVFERDHFQCIHCQTNRGPFNANHIRPFSVLLHENNISSLEDALQCADLWNITNGETLCEPCHKETDSYG